MFFFWVKNSISRKNGPTCFYLRAYLARYHVNLISYLFIISDRKIGHKITEIKRCFIHNENHSPSSVRHLVVKSSISYPEKLIQFSVQKKCQPIKCHRHRFTNFASFRPRTKIDVYTFEQSNFNMYERFSR